MFKSNRLTQIHKIFDAIRKNDMTAVSQYFSSLQFDNKPLERADRVTLASMYLVAEDVGNKTVMADIQRISGMESYLKVVRENYRAAMVQSYSPVPRSKL